MMATDETQTDEVTVKMEETIVEEPEKDVGKDSTATVKVKDEYQDSLMEVDEQNKESPETASILHPNIDEHVKEEETACINKNVEGELELAKDENKPQEEVTDKKVDREQDKDAPIEEKIVSPPSTSPDQQKEALTNIAQESGEEWDVLGTDDEKEELGDKKTSGVWMPDVNVIIDLYQKLDRHGILELQWKYPGRRLPPGEVDEKKEELENLEQEVVKPEAEEEKQEEGPTEFDFDVETPSITSMAPRRTPGSGQALGSGKKRVARMDKIFNDMLRHKKIDEELARVGDELEDGGNKTDTTPQRHVGKFRIRKDF